MDTCGGPIDDITALRKTAMTLRSNRLYQPAAIHRALGIEPFTEAVEVSQPIMAEDRR